MQRCPTNTTAALDLLVDAGLVLDVVGLVVDRVRGDDRVSVSQQHQTVDGPVEDFSVLIVATGVPR